MTDELTLLQELVAIPSVSGQEAEASAYLVERMREYGYQADVDEVGNAVGMIETADEEGGITRDIVLLGHIDTVPGDIPVRVEDGCLWGRGSVDAKGPLAAFVAAGAQASLASGTRLIVIGAVEEEAATSKGAWHIVDKYRPEYCIIGEPSGWDAVTLGYKGRILLDYEFKQSGGHSAGPERAAAEYAVDWWNDIQAYAAGYNNGSKRVFDQLTPSLREIQTGSNGLSNTVRAKVGVRVPPDFNLMEFQAATRRAAGDASITEYGIVPAYQAERNSGLVRTFSAVLRQQGARPRLKLKSGTSDMNVVGPIWRCPMVAYGPGDSKLDHTPNEHMVIEDYQRAITILAGVLSQL